MNKKHTIETLHTWMWFILIGFVFLMSTNFIFVRLYIQTPPGHVYTGIGFEAAADKYVYYSMITQGSSGRMMMQNTHTSEPQQPMLASPHWYFVGQLARLLGGSIPAAYHLTRVFLTIIFLIVLLYFIKIFFKETIDILCAYATVLFGSGLGWLYIAAHQEMIRPVNHWLLFFPRIPADLNVPELTPYMNFLQSPLFMLSYILLLLIWLLYIRDVWSPLYRNLIIIISTFFLIIIHPYDVFFVVSVAASYMIWDYCSSGSRQLIAPFISIIFGASLALMYHVYSVVSQPSLMGWLDQNITFSPALGSYAWAFGILAPAALMGTYFMRGQYKTMIQWRLLFLWVVLIFIGIYLPISFNRRISSAWLIPISIFAYVGVRGIVTRIRYQTAQIFVVVFFCITAVSGVLYQLAQQVWYTPRLEEKYNYYLDPYIHNFLTIFKSFATYEDVALPSEEYIGTLIAAYAPTKTYIGHPHQTAHYELKKNTMEWFFAKPQTPSSLARREDFLRKNRISYIVVYKPSMRDSYEWIETLSNVSRVYDSEVTRIYSVAL